MDEYGRGGVLGAATFLPATSAMGLLFIGRINIIVIYGLFLVSILSFIINVAMIFRYIQNRKRELI